MRYGSVCSGIEATTVAWHNLGWKPAFFSEIEAAPRAILAHHYPEVPLHGDFTTIGADEYGPIDLLVGGTPCQSFSIAGLRDGLDDDRGNLALEFLRLAQRKRPKWLVWENVPGVLSSNGGRDFGAILGGVVELGYGFAYRVLDAQYFRVPQRRRRVFVVGYLGDWRSAAAVLFERHSLQGHPAPRREKGQAVARSLRAQSQSSHREDSDNFVSWPAEVASTLNAAFGAKMGLEDQHIRGADCLSVSQCLTTGTGQRYDAETETLIHMHGGGFDVATLDGLETARTLTRRYDGSPCHDRGPDIVAFAHQQGGSIDMHMSDDCALALQRCQTQAVTYPINMQIATRHNALGEGTGLGIGSESDPDFTLLRDHHHAVGTNSAVRRLTPRECERLQGFPDDYTLVPYRNSMMSDGPRYKALGNSMAVPVMRWIGERIQQAEDKAQ